MIVPHFLVQGGSSCRVAQALTVNEGERRSVKVVEQRMGAEGNPPLALRKSIDAGMRPNSAGQQVNYLGIYETDVVAAEMRPVLRYAASLFAR